MNEANPDVSERIQQKRGKGEPMPESERSFFEPRFGADLSGVRVHRDAEAAELARAVNAQAFTIGSDVFFGQGKYAQDPEGCRLFAHELTHVVQQGGGMALGEGVQRQESARIERQPEAAIQREPEQGNESSHDEKTQTVAAVALAEVYEGQELQIAWIYMNRIQRFGYERGLRGSTPYRRNSYWYRFWRAALGDPAALQIKYRDGGEPTAMTLRHFFFETPYGRGVRQRALHVRSDVRKIVQNPESNPYPGWTGQGNLADFNLPGKIWSYPRWYFILQELNPDLQTFVKALPAKNRSEGGWTFVFHRQEIIQRIEAGYVWPQPPDSIPKIVAKDGSLQVE